jgi:hypothetical protein
MTINRENLINKVRALLQKTMANGCSEAEALAALAKARAMIDAYEIDDNELTLTREEKAVLREDTEHDPHAVKRFLLSAVADFAGVKCWLKSGRQGGHTFCGMASDIDLAQWLLAHLSQFVLVELFGYLHKQIMPKGQRRRMINGFVLGCTGRISARLRELTAQSARNDATRARDPRVADHAGGSRALVLAEIKRDAIKATMAAAGIQLRSRSSSRVSNADAHSAGRAAGDRATFGRPVGSGNLRLR